MRRFGNEIFRRKFYILFQDDNFCTEESAEFFKKILAMGYDIFEPKLPLRKVKGCQNRNYQPDLLLIDKNIYQALVVKKGTRKHVYEMPVYHPKDTDIVSTFWESKPPFETY